MCVCFLWIERDEDDTDRQLTLRRRVKADDIKEMDYAAYIASSSDEDDDVDDEDVKEKVRTQDYDLARISYRG